MINKVFACHKVHSGVHGFVKDQDGKPVDEARIAVSNRRHDVFSANDGDFWRLLVPGSYDITVSAKGFEQETKSCTVLPDKPATLNFTLTRMRMREPRHQLQQDSWPRDRVSHGGEFRHTQEDGVSQSGGLRRGLDDERADDFDGMRSFGRSPRIFPRPK